MFQSLEGILSDLELSQPITSAPKINQFQSLEGILSDLEVRF